MFSQRVASLPVKAMHQGEYTASSFKADIVYSGRKSLCTFDRVFASLEKFSIKAPVFHYRKLIGLIAAESNSIYLI